QTRIVSGAVFFFFALAIPIAAQNDNGTLRVTVWDPQRAFVSSASVLANYDNTGVSTAGVMSSPGTYVFPHLLAGTYTIRIEAPGFAVYVGREIVVLAAQTTEVTASLSLGQATTEVSVRASANMAQTESSQLSGSFEGRTISDVPIVAGANYSVLN